MQRIFKHVFHAIGDIAVVGLVKGLNDNFVNYSKGKLLCSEFIATGRRSSLQQAFYYIITFHSERKNNSDQTHSWPRDKWLSVSREPSDHHSTIALRGARVALNWALIMLRDTIQWMWYFAVWYFIKLHDYKHAGMVTRSFLLSRDAYFLLSIRDLQIRMSTSRIFLPDRYFWPFLQIENYIYKWC